MSTRSAIESPSLVERLRHGLCFTICFIAINPVFLALGIKGIVLFAAFLLLTLASNRIVARREHGAFYVLALLLVATSCLSSLAGNSIAPLAFALFFLLTFLAVIQTRWATAVHLVELATRMFAALILLALVGALYHLAGGTPLFTLVNADGRDNDFYLTTFSNAQTFIIRPSAIYDEPGAFSFFICMVVAMRSLLGMPAKTSAWLLLGGLITQSITHVLFLVIWSAWAGLSSRGGGDNGRNVASAVGFVLTAAVIWQIGVLDWAFERALEFYENPWLNPRQRAFDEIVDNLRNGGTWLGFDPRCTQRLPDYCADLGENPLTPLIYGGLAASWPYYLFVIGALVSPAFTSKGLLYAGIAVLLLQRPYLLEFPYSATFGLLFVIAVGPSAAHLARREPAPSPPDEPSHSEINGYVRPRQ